MTCCPYWIKITKLEVTTAWRIFVSSCMCGCVLRLSIVYNYLWPHWPTRLLCPWDFPGKHTGLGCHFLLQAIFHTWGSNPHLPCVLHCRIIFLPLSHLGSPLYSHHVYNYFYIFTPYTSIYKGMWYYLSCVYFINFIHILFQLAVCVQYYNVVHKKLVHLFWLFTGSMQLRLIIILYPSLI